MTLEGYIYYVKQQIRSSPAWNCQNHNFVARAIQHIDCKNLENGLYNHEVDQKHLEKQEYTIFNRICE